MVTDLRKVIREVPDFPAPGRVFRDVSPLFRHAEAFRSAVDRMVERYRGDPLDAIAGIEARGLVIASAMARDLGLGLAVVGRVGTLAGDTEAEPQPRGGERGGIEILREAVAPGQRVLLVDDVLATGGTAAAAGRLVERLGGVVEGYAFLAELGFLGGRKQLGATSVFSLVQYASAPMASEERTEGL